MTKSGIVNTSKWAFDPLEDRPVVAERRNIYDGVQNFVAPGPATAVVPTRHEVSDPYAHAPALRADAHASTHTYTPGQRAYALLVKATAITLFLAVMTLAAMFILMDDFEFFIWLFLASFEWCAMFALLAYWDFWETPAAHLRQKTTGYLKLMETEQRARLKAIYNWEE